MAPSKPQNLDSLHQFIQRIKQYPVTAREIVELAINEQADPIVVNFYRAFRDDEAFDSQDELIIRSEQIQLMDAAAELEEHPRAPYEWL
ncbi:MAG TPA: hypothetical protein VGS28_01365 [Candidatus Saccharimonadales bacterium]|nr:hypothetical protein [Candidatus Saccharimonadales bacterium]